MQLDSDQPNPTAAREEDDAREERTHGEGGARVSDGEALMLYEY